MATFWAILHGENEIGSSLHYIENSGIDNGRIIKISTQKINFELSLIENIANLYPQGCRDILEFLEKLENNCKIDTTTQENLGKSQYFSTPQEEDLLKCAKIINLF